MSRHETAAWAAAALCLALAAIGWAIHPARFHLAWIAALATLWAWPLGSIALLLIHRLTGGAWGVALAPALRAGAASLPVVALALVPVLLGGSLYPWTRHDIPLPNRFWLNTPFVLARAAIDLLTWFGLAALALLPRFRTGTVAPAIGLLLLAFTFTFAVVDLTLSLQPRFTSSVYGMIEGTAAVLFALSVASLPTALAAPRDTLPDLGRLMLALVVLWAYLDFMQFLIVWESNLPSEAAWYAPRITGGWGAVAAAIATLHFLLPLALLVLPAIQRSRRALAAIAGLLIATELLRGCWLVLPQAAGGIGWIAPACMLGLGGLFAGVTARAGGLLRDV